MITAEVSAATEDYRVNLEVFSGPMDLLLYLISKEEVDIYDIPIARITSQYMRYIEMMQTLNLEVAGEFILMAATLIRIKTRLLLPRDEIETGEVDPREELIMALVEYRKYKEAGEVLREKALAEERVYVPNSPVEKIEGRTDLKPVTSLYDLLVAFRDAMSARRSETTHDVNPEEISIEDRIRSIMFMLHQKDGMTFQELFADIPRRIIAVVTFVALLELARSHRVSLFQAFPYGEMRVYRGETFDAPQQEIDLIEYSTISE